MEIGVHGKDRGELERLLGLFEAGKLSGALTVARLLLVSRDVASIERWLVERFAAAPGARHELLHLIEQHRHGCHCVAALRQGHVAEVGPRGMLGEAPNPPDGEAVDGEAVDGEAARRDRAELAARTARDNFEREIVHCFEAWGLLGAKRRTLELGCGAGRMQAALSSKVALAAGVDTSVESVARARWCCSRLLNARHEVADGSDLSGFAAASFDLVYAVALPAFAVSARDERLSRTFAEVARVLSPEGDFVLVASAQSASSMAAPDVARRAGEHGFEVVASEQPFRFQDGMTYRLRRSR